MQPTRAYLVPLAVLCLCPGAAALAEQANPMSKVIEIVDGLTSKIKEDGEAEALAYQEYSHWCEDTSKHTGFAIEAAETSKEKLEARIVDFSSSIATFGLRASELGTTIATSQAELKDATTVRKKEAAEFAASEAELTDTIDTLKRAITFLTQEFAKNPASLAQWESKNATGETLKAISTVLDAAAFPSDDQAKLEAFVQAQQGEVSDDLELAAPAAATYQSHSTSTMDVLNDLKEKAEAQVSDLRKSERSNRHNFQTLRQSLEDQVAADTKDRVDEAAASALAAQAKAAAEGDLEMTSKDLSTARQQLAVAHTSCLQVAANHEATVAAREEELRVLAQARELLEQTVTGATSQTYALLQLSSWRLGLRMRSRDDLTGSEVAVAVKQLAKRQHSANLAQLASRIAAVFRFRRASGGDPFAQVRGLIEAMLSRLEAEASAEAAEKAFCDEQIANTQAKKGELDDDIAKMTLRVDLAVARSTQLKGEVSQLQAELRSLARDQAELDGIRRESHAASQRAKTDLELGLSGVRQALDLLRDYYSGAGVASMLQDDDRFGAFMQQPALPDTHAMAQGAGESLINILLVVESDFATNLAKEESEEADAQSEYEKTTQEDAVAKTVKDQAIKYKTQESKAHDRIVAEYASDRETAREELSAVLEYFTQIKDRCIARPETYQARKARRAAEIQGLKEALSILEDETALAQRKRSGSFHGFLAASAGL